VGVFVNQPASHVNSVAKLAGLSAVQLHGDEDERAAAEMTLPVIKAVSVRDGAFPDRQWPERVMLLIDADDQIRRGGTGMTANWPAAAALARRRPVLLAGGLRPDNVAEAIRCVRPFGIDVSSGVEQSPGIKDRRLLAALFEAVRGGEKRHAAGSNRREIQPRKREHTKKTATKTRRHESSKQSRLSAKTEPRKHEHTKKTATKTPRHESSKQSRQSAKTEPRKHERAKKTAAKTRKHENTK
jgi:phosphoribosylanthranilate isomerase